MKISKVAGRLADITHGLLWLTVLVIALPFAASAGIIEILTKTR